MRLAAWGYFFAKVLYSVTRPSWRKEPVWAGAGQTHQMSAITADSGYHSSRRGQVAPSPVHEGKRAAREEAPNELAARPQTPNLPNY